VIETRHEPPDGPAAVALWDEYMALVSERAGPGFEASPRIFGTVDVFRGPNAAWIVLYDDGAPVACAGLRELEPGVAEIKRMFVTPRARGRGLARRLLADLEGIARDAGQREVRLFTTDMLPEAMALYASEGYTVRSEHPVEGGRSEFWLEKPL
jgi:GNAT superfamily N-acetyltransferase